MHHDVFRLHCVYAQLQNVVPMKTMYILLATLLEHFIPLEHKQHHLTILTPSNVHPVKTCWRIYRRPSRCVKIRPCIMEWISLQWRHNDHDSASNHQPHGCLLNRLFRSKSKKTSKLRVTGLCAGNSPYKWPVTPKMFPFDDVIMSWLLV